MLDGMLAKIAISLTKSKEIKVAKWGTLKIYFLKKRLDNNDTR